jgi:heat-inducible transcriptional repressor
LSELTERQLRILGITIQEHIREARPVGSETIRERYGLRVSPATIRNEFALLADKGYLAQPHTSSGRVPTAEGYRLFVRRLLGEPELSPSEQLLIRHQFHQITGDPDQWMRLAAAVLAHISQSASLIAAPQAKQTRFRHVELISISETTGLMILVLQDRAVHQQTMVLGKQVDQAELSRLSNKLNDLFCNLGAEEIAAGGSSSSDEEVDELEREVVQRVVELMDSHAAQSGREIYRDGLSHILQQPEFDEISRARQIVSLLEQDSALEAIFGQAVLSNGVQVIRDCSMVLSGYGLPGEAKGVLGVLGPMRMPYGRAIPAVRYVAKLMSDLINRLYGDMSED